MIVSATQEISSKHVTKIFTETGETVVTYTSEDTIPQEVADKTEILLTFGNNLSKEKEKPFSISRFPNLKWIQVLSAGFDELPLGEIEQRNITVTNSAGIHGIPMSEYVIAAMLYFEKDFNRYFTLKNQKKWDRSKLPGELVNREVLIYGTGNIGQAIANKLNLFGVKLYGVNTKGHAVTPFLETYSIENAKQKLKEADYVISILPSTEKTQGLFDRGYLQMLKEDAVFINIGRGDVADEKAVVEMLESGRLKGAVLDVFEKEPLPEESPVWKCDNLILSPHMSAKSVHYMDRCVDIFTRNLKAYRHKEPMINLVNVSKGY